MNKFLIFLPLFLVSCTNPVSHIDYEPMGTVEAQENCTAGYELGTCMSCGMSPFTGALDCGLKVTQCPVNGVKTVEYNNTMVTITYENGDKRSRIEKTKIKDITECMPA